MVPSLNKALMRGTWPTGKSSGMEPLSAGLNSVELRPMQKVMASIQFQSSVTMPHAPASIAASSSVFAQMTRLFLAKRSASQPLHAEKSTNGSANRNVTCDWNTALPVVTARSRPACLKKLSLKVPRA